MTGLYCLSMQIPLTDYFDIYVQFKFHAVGHEKSFISSGPDILTAISAAVRYSVAKVTFVDKVC